MGNYSKQVQTGTDRFGAPEYTATDVHKRVHGRKGPPAAGSGAKKTRAGMGIPSEQWIASAAKGIKPG